MLLADLEFVELQQQQSQLSMPVMLNNFLEALEFEIKRRVEIEE